MSLVYKLKNAVLIRRVQCLSSAVYRQYADNSAHPTTPPDINEAIWAGIVVKKSNYTGITAVIQNHTGLKIPVKSQDKIMKKKLHDLEVGMNVLVKGCLDQEKVVRQIGSSYKRIGQNIIDAQEIEVIPPEEVEMRKEERNNRVVSKFSSSELS